jgi:hypothetical protein
MGFFEFFFPEQAQASHLKRLVELQGASAYDEHAVRNRLRQTWEERQNPKPREDISSKVAALEQEIGAANLVIEALLEELEARGGVSREALKKRMHEIDARDGKVDGRKCQ